VAIAMIQKARAKAKLMSMTAHQHTRAHPAGKSRKSRITSRVRQKVRPVGRAAEARATGAVPVGVLLGALLEYRGGPRSQKVVRPPRPLESQGRPGCSRMVRRPPRWRHSTQVAAGKQQVWPWWSGCRRLRVRGDGQVPCKDGENIM
jgi:hypothetical protein